MTSKTILYLGSDPSRFSSEDVKITHFPLFEIVPRPFSLPNLQVSIADWDAYTHTIFTSKHTVAILSDMLAFYGLVPHRENMVIAVGQSTAKALEQRGWKVALCAEKESQEGILNLLSQIDWKEESYVFLPRSSLARGALEHFFLERWIRHQPCDLYDTVEKQIEEWPDLEQFDEIFFTSPSTVAIFFSKIRVLPKRPCLKAIGPVTFHSLLRHQHFAKFEVRDYDRRTPY